MHGRRFTLPFQSSEFREPQTFERIANAAANKFILLETSLTKFETAR